MNRKVRNSSMKRTNLDLGEGNLKTETLIEVRIQSVLFDGGLLLL